LDFLSLQVKVTLRVPNYIAGKWTFVSKVKFLI